MPAYVIGHLQEAAPHPEIAEYIERITATFEPYGGRFLVHATQHEVKEGGWPGHVVVRLSRDRRGAGLMGLTRLSGDRTAALAAHRGRNHLGRRRARGLRPDWRRKGDARGAYHDHIEDIVAHHWTAPVFA
jgi:hypothetical protein